MDKEMVDKVTKLVMEVLTEMQEKNPVTEKNSVKIWHHETPLPKPIVMKGTNGSNMQINNEIISFSPYR
ncbi:hypothetical protein [Oceanobacillus sp. CAU 1775]